MRRGMDLVRELLLKLEALDLKPGVLVSFFPNDPEIAVDGWTDNEVAHHLSMIYRAGFIDYGSDEIGSLSGDFFFRDLTWAGRDFLDSVRDPKIWTETKSRAGKLGTWTVDLLSGIAKGYAKAKAAEYGIPIG